MKTTRVSARTKALNALLNKARRKALILETMDGQRFVLAPIDGWQGYELDKDGDVTKNKKLMKYLANRRGKGETIGLAEIKAELT